MKQPNKKIANWLVLYDNDQTSDAANVKVPDDHKYIIELFLKNNLNPKLFLVGPGISLKFVKDYDFYEEIFLHRVKIYENHFFFNEKEDLKNHYTVPSRLEKFKEIYEPWLNKIEETKYSLIYLLKNWMIGGCLRTVRDRMDFNIVSNNIHRITFMPTPVKSFSIAGYDRTSKRLEFNLTHIEVEEEIWPNGILRNLFDNDYQGQFLHVTLHEITHLVHDIEGNPKIDSGTNFVSSKGAWYREGIAEAVTGIYSSKLFQNYPIGSYDDGSFIRAEISTDPDYYLDENGKISEYTFSDTTPDYYNSAAAVFYLHERIKQTDERGLKAINETLIEIQEEAKQTWERWNSNVERYGQAAVDVLYDIYQETLGPLNYNVFDSILEKLTNWRKFEEFKSEFLTPGIGNVFMAELAEHHLNTGDICNLGGSFFGGPVITIENNVVYQDSDKFEALFETNINESIKKMKKMSKKIKDANIENVLLFFYDSEKVKEEYFKDLLKIDETLTFYCVVISNDGLCSLSIGRNEGSEYFKNSSFSNKVKFACASKENLEEILNSINIFSTNDKINSSKIDYNNLLIEAKIKQ